MHYLAPLALLLLASGALYKTTEIFSTDEYDLFIAVRFGSLKAADDAQLALAVKRGIILQEHKTQIMSGKWGPDGTRLKSDVEGQAAYAMAVGQTAAISSARTAQAMTM